MLLGYADIKKSIRVFRCEFIEACTISHGGRNSHDGVIASPQVSYSFSEYSGKSRAVVLAERLTSLDIKR